jgi:hypothetical protein
MPKLKKRKKLISMQKLIHKVDKALQDWYRTQGLYCLCCGKPANVMHHHILKSRSNNLRFNELNLIPLCSTDHFKLHAGDISIANAYRKHYPDNWEDELLAQAHVYKKFTRDELNELLLKYKV